MVLPRGPDSKIDRWIGGGCAVFAELYSAPLWANNLGVERKSLGIRSSIWLNDPLMMQEVPTQRFGGYTVAAVSSGMASMTEPVSATNSQRISSAAYVWRADLELGPWYKWGNNRAIIVRAYVRGTLDNVTNFFFSNTFSWASSSAVAGGLTLVARL